MKRMLIGLVMCFSMAQAGGDVAPAAPVAPVETGCADGWYVGGALSVQRTYAGGKDWFKDTILGQDKTVPLTGIVGYRINCYLAVEGRVSHTVYEEDYARVLTYSLFLKPIYPLTESLSVYGLLGYGVVNVEGTDGDVPAANVGKTIIDKGFFQWGFGASYAFDEHWSLFVDYTRLMSKASIPPQPLYIYDVGVRTWDHISDDSINIGITYRF